MLSRPITFDRFVRGALVALAVVMLFTLVNYLSAVLIPFFAAWIVAYLIHPIVCFVQEKLRVRNRTVSIIITLVSIAVLVAGIIQLIIPPFIEQFRQLGALINTSVYGTPLTDVYPAIIREWLTENKEAISHFFESGEVTSAVRNFMPKVFKVVSHTANIIISIVGSFIALIYLFFILLDYDRLSSGLIRLFPKKSRPFWQELIEDVKRELNSYIRGQALVALCIGILFCIGFTIIDFPMAIALGILIGIMSLVPYVHGLAFIPMILLSLLKAGTTGESFWGIMLAATLVFIIIQLITDLVLVPRIMGKAMRMSPAIILLSLSVWGTLLGFIGLVIALPLTTLLHAYYKRYITEDNISTTDDSAMSETDATVLATNISAMSPDTDSDKKVHNNLED